MYLNYTICPCEFWRDYDYDTQINGSDCHIGFPSRDRHSIIKAHMTWTDDTTTNTHEQNIRSMFDDAGLQIIRIANAYNPSLYSRFRQKQREISERICRLMGPHSDCDTGHCKSTCDYIAFHASKSSKMDLIYAEGLDCRLSATGYFGKGIYSSPSVAKANSYFKHIEGTPESNSNIRYMLALRVCMGKTYTFKDFETCTSLTREPDGYDSVTGYVKDGVELVVYNNDQVYISHVIFYTTKPVLTDTPAPTTATATPAPTTATPAPAITNGRRPVLLRKAKHNKRYSTKPSN